MLDIGSSVFSQRPSYKDKFYKGMMKQVRTVEMPELTEEQIEVWRCRSTR